MLVSPMMPHLAEEAWAQMGGEGLLAQADWPEVDPALLVDDEVTIAVQVKGKLRDTLTAPKDASKDDLEALALASEKVQQFDRGRSCAQGDCGARQIGQYRYMMRVLAPFALLASLAACGLQPIYAGGANGAVAQGLAAVEVPAIQGQAGWLVRNALTDRLGQSGASANAQYRLDVVLDDELEGLGLLTDDTIGRERRTLRARYQLVDLATGIVMLDATAGSDAGIDVVSSEYATIAAEQTALGKPLAGSGPPDCDAPDAYVARSAMKANQRDYARVAQRAGPSCKLFFLCGPDEAGSSAAAQKLIATLDNPGDRVELSGSELRNDPVRLMDEARSTSLFGDQQHIYVRCSGEEANEALKTFCELVDRGEAHGAWPVFIVATSATDKSRSAKLLIKRDDAMVAMFYPPDLSSVTADIRTMADAAGLRLGGDVAERIAHGTGLDVRLAASEVEKLALYLDASPQSPKQADQAAFDAISASTEEDSFVPLVNASLSGDLRKLPAEIKRLRDLSLNPVGVALALERRAAQLAQLSAKLRPNDDMQQFLKAERVFFRDQRDIGRQLQQWRGGKLERLVPRLTNLHRALLANSQMGELILAQELTQIARYAAARR